MKTLLAKYLSLVTILATVAWFFWNPEGWSFKWEPVVAFFASLVTFIGFDWKDHAKAAKAEQVKPTVHPSDVFLLKRLLDLLPSSGVIHFLRTHDFLGSFRRAEIEPIKQFLYEWGNAEHEFQDQDIEALKKELYEAARDFNTLIGKYTSPNKSGFQAVRPDHYEGGDQREFEFQREAEEIGEAADAVVEKHQKFVRVARERFGDGTI